MPKRDLRPHYPPDRKSDLTACPSCGSGRLICVLGTDLDLCVKCLRCWERLRPEDSWMIDGEMLAFATPCDNCAFRGGSTERQDKDRWQDLQSMLSRGGSFYCHKGVPFKMDPATGASMITGSNEFDFPRKTKLADVAGPCHPYQQYDTARMRLCRGFLNAHIAPILKAATTEG